MSILVFDIETIPDTASGRRLHDLHDLSDEAVGEAMFALQRAKSGSDFLPHYLQKIVAISAVISQGQHLKVWSLGDETSDEKDLITRFFNGIEKYKPTLVSWNGSGFDLPVLHYRALLHGVTAALYWEHGEHESTFKWNNYLSRYHYRHIDLMDLLAAYQNRAFAPLDDIAVMLGFPGKMGMHGSQVFKNYLAGHLKSIRDYCETDVLNTYCVYLRFELMRGNLTPTQYEDNIQQLRDYLMSESDRPHLQDFCQAIGTS